jgi:hypothetical protein
VGETRSLTTASLTVQPASAGRFLSGGCDFLLIVVDDSGNESQPDRRHVILFDSQAPTAILDGPVTVPLQQTSFTLSGARSFDVGGTLAAYRFANLDCPVLQAWPVGAVITQASASVPVAASAGSPFNAGLCNFSLIVVDDSGNESTPAMHRVAFVHDEAPTAVLDGPASVPIHQASFTLSGGRSFDVGGTLDEYRFANLDCTGLNAWPVGAEIVQPSASLLVAANAGANFNAAACNFSLVVVDDTGNLSPPVMRRVIFADDQAPTAVLDAPASISRFTELVLTGIRSFDVGGQVVTYQWTNLSLQGAANFDVNATVSTSTSTFTVNPGANGFVPGNAQVRLVVVDGSGNISPPVVAAIGVTP